MQPDIIILTETWIHTEEEGVYTIVGYNGYFTSQDNNKAGGVAIYVKATLTSHKVASLTCNADVCIVNVLLGDRILQVVGGYRSPNLRISNPDMFIREDLPCILKYGDATVVDRLWATDANINIDKSSSIAEQYLNTLAEHGFEWVKTGHTRVNNKNNAGTTIDHIFIKSIHVQYDCPRTIDTNGVSDHHMVTASLITETNKQTYPAHARRINWKLFDKALAMTDLTPLLGEMDPSRIIEMLNQKLEWCRRLSQNKERQQRSPQNKKPWITPGILASIRTRNRLWQRCRRHPLSVAIHHRYKVYRNKLREIIRLSENLYIKNSVEGTANPKEAWRFINAHIRGKNTSRKMPVYLQGYDIKQSDLDRANKFFAGTGRHNSSSLTNTVMGNLPSYKYNTPCSRFEAPDIDKITTLINKLSNGKAPGVDNLSTISVKKNRDAFAVLIHHLATRIFETGIYPLALKKAVLTLIYKKGSPEDLNNYRPISLLSVINKVIEKIMVEQIANHLESNQMLHPYQYGFRKGRIIEQAVLCLQEYVLKAIDQGSIPVAVFLDFSCAFDTVPRGRLLAKLECMGIQGLALNLLKSYLTDRTQVLKVNNQLSGEEKVETGVPQGGTLAPLLFIAYVNDLLRTNATNQIRVGYADDTTIIFRFQGEVDRAIIEDTLGEVSAWSIANGLHLNSSKSKYIVFGHQNTRLNSDIRVLCAECKVTGKCRCTYVQGVRSIKYLGIVIDEKLDWHEHVQKLKIKLRAGLACIAKLKKSVTARTLKAVYGCIIETHLRYGILAYGAAFPTTLKPLQTLQNVCLRKILAAQQTDSTESLYTRAEIHTLKQLYYTTLLTKMHIKDDNTRKHLIDAHRPSHTYSTRRAASDSVIPTVVRLERTRRFYTNIYVRLYNILPTSIKTLGETKISHRKKVIREYIAALPTSEHNGMLS